jgi:8-oxo-dGTP diphosphatase
MPQINSLVTLVFILKDDQILLAEKLRGFGKGKPNGVGGKPQEGETPEETAVREAKEEVGVNIDPKDLERVATIEFRFDKIPQKQDWNQTVAVFFAHWKPEMGEPQETEEMKPFWCDLSEIPYDKMWDTDHYWLPQVLKGKRIEATFFFKQDPQTEEYKVQEHKITPITL